MFAAAYITYDDYLAGRERLAKSKTANATLGEAVSEAAYTKEYGAKGAMVMVTQYPDRVEPPAAVAAGWTTITQKQWDAAQDILVEAGEMREELRDLKADPLPEEKEK